MIDLVCRQKRRPPIDPSVQLEFRQLLEVCFCDNAWKLWILSLLQRCWDSDPLLRPTADEIKDSVALLRRRANFKATMDSGTLEREAGDV